MVELVCLFLGAVAGFPLGVWYTLKQIPRILARMSDTQLSALAEQVAEVRANGSAGLGSTNDRSADTD